MDLVKVFDNLLIEKINNLIEIVSIEDLEFISDCINSISSYIKFLTGMEVSIKVARFRCSTQQDYIQEIEELDRNRKRRHDAVIASTKILNKLCQIYETEEIYAGNLDDRWEVAEFARNVANAYLDRKFIKVS